MTDTTKWKPARLKAALEEVGALEALYHSEVLPSAVEIAKIWLNANSQPYDMPHGLSESLLAFTIMLRRLVIDPVYANYHTDLDAWLQLGIFPCRENAQIHRMSMAQLIQTLDLMADQWETLITLSDCRFVATVVMQRLGQIACSAQTPDVADDSRFFRELEGVPQRLQAEEDILRKHALQKQLIGAGGGGGAHNTNTDASDAAMVRWRQDRHLLPSLALVTYTEPILRDMLVQCRLFRRLQEIDSHPLAALLRHRALTSLVGCQVRLVFETRMRYEYQRLLAPGDAQRYQRQCPNRDSHPRAVLKRFRSMRTVRPSEGLLDILKMEEDAASALTLVKRVLRRDIVVQASHEPPTTVGLRFVAHRLACVTPEACFVAPKGGSAYVVIAKYVSLAGLMSVEATQEAMEASFLAAEKPMRQIAM